MLILQIKSFLEQSSHLICYWLCKSLQMTLHCASLIHAQREVSSFRSLPDFEYRKQCKMFKYQVHINIDQDSRHMVRLTTLFVTETSITNRWLAALMEASTSLQFLQIYHLSLISLFVHAAQSNGYTSKARLLKYLLNLAYYEMINMT